MKGLVARLRHDQEGATAVEYGIMVALIAVVIIVAVSFLGGTLSNVFGDACEELADGSSDDVECQEGEWVPSTPE